MTTTRASHRPNGDVPTPMLLTVRPPQVELVGVTDALIQELVNLTPDYSAGRRLHDLYANAVQAWLPGNYSQLIGTGPTFRSVFYPSWRPDTLLALIADAGLDDPWWRDFSVAVLCQAIAEMGSNIRPQMLVGDINGAVTTKNAQLRERSAVVYAGVLARTYSPLQSLLARLDAATAKAQFRDALLQNVLTRQLWYQAGVWTSPDWEIFNQYAKYLALGATVEEVDDLIRALVEAGLPVPAEVGVQAWRRYSEELRDRPSVTVDDIRSAASGPIAATTYLPTFGGGMPAQLPNGNCYEFTASSQPGNRYRRAPGGCCFTGETRVLSGTGEPVRLRDLRRGDEVLTPDGPKMVAYLARPLRTGRALHRLGGEGPVFTESHPFRNAAVATSGPPPPALLALDPALLAGTVPTLSEEGIARLATGSELMRRAPGSSDKPHRVEVTDIAVVDPGPDDDSLYDVRLEEHRGPSGYWAGGGQDYYLVSPEYPVISEAGAGATAVVALMEGLASSDGPAGQEWPVELVGALERYGPGVFHGALTSALAATPSFGEPPPDVPLWRRVDRLYAGLAQETAETAAVMAALFDGLLSSLGQWLGSLVEMGWRSSTVLGGDVLAVTVFDLALRPGNPLTAHPEASYQVTVGGRRSTEQTTMWDRDGRDNTEFHRFLDQIVHLDLDADDRPQEIVVAARLPGVALPILRSRTPALTTGSAHTLKSAVLVDTTGAVVGDLRLDTRRLGRDAAAEELSTCGLWTPQTAEAYADALGRSMVRPVLSLLGAQLE